MIVAIDGPAGAGKSSVAKRLADRLGFAFLDTGSMYRGVTWYCLENNVELADIDKVASVASQLKLRLDHERVWVNQTEVTDEIRKPRVTKSIRSIADNIQVRVRMVELQREWAANRNVVTEGRDQGTVAFPDAECKIFLTASPSERARRRVQQLAENGITVEYHEILQMQELRDLEDRERSIGGLRRADDAIEVVTDGMSEAEVLDQLESIVRSIQARSVVPNTRCDADIQGSDI